MAGLIAMLAVVVVTTVLGPPFRGSRSGNSAIGQASRPRNDGIVRWPVGVAVLTTLADLVRVSARMCARVR